MKAALGPSHWWPGESAFEVAVGAILTQNTNWNNVERALSNLRREDLLRPEPLYAVPEERLAELIRPAGYFRLKAKRLRNFLLFLKNECRFDMEALADSDGEDVRQRLLSVKGVGPETADSIVLYALGMPSFVVDAYTHRIAGRHGLVPEEVAYDELRELFMDALPRDVALYNEYHALLVRTAKQWCLKRRAHCEPCPLREFLQ
jgi:endonuclease-3 related protein